jgi:hypothetical protein
MNASTPSHALAPLEDKDALMAPTFGNGKICCIELPAADIQQSSGQFR